MLHGEVAREFVVLPAANHELDFILLSQGFEVVAAERVRFARVWALYVNNLYDCRGYPCQWALSAGLKQNAIANLQELIHERNYFPLLQHRLAPGNFHQPAIRTEPSHFIGDLIDGHLPSARERIFAVAPRTP